MSLVKVENFSGLIPRADPHVLPPNAATEALNIKISSGAITPWKEPLSIQAVSAAQSIYLYEDIYWLVWSTIVSAVRSPLASDAYKRLYWTGDGAPKMATFDLITTGSTSYPNDSRDLGIIAPTAAPTVSVPAISAYSASATYAVGAFFSYTYEDATVLSTFKCLVAAAPYSIPAYSATETYVVGAVVTNGGLTYRCGLAIEAPEAFTAAHWYVVTGAVPILEAVLNYRITLGYFTELFDTDQETRAYVFRYVSDLGEAGPPSSASADITIFPGQVVTVAGIADYYAYGTKELYRTNTGVSTTDYQFLVEIALGTTSYADSIEDDALGEVITSTSWDPPPSDLAGLIALPNGCLAGYIEGGNQVCISYPYMPHAWPADYRYPVTGIVKGIGAFGSSVLVATDDQPSVLTGQDPAGMSLEKFENGSACVSSQGVVDMGYAVAYPSPTGLMVAGVGTAGLATAKVLGKDDWQAYNPSTMRSCFYGGLYIAFTDNGGFIFDAQTNDLVDIDMVATAMYHDPASGNLYLVVADEIVQWDGGTADLVNLWKSRPFTLAKPSRVGWAQVKANTYPVTFKLYGDDDLIAIKTVRNARPFRTSCRKLVSEIHLEVSGASNIWMVAAAESIEELRRA